MAPVSKKRGLISFSGGETSAYMAQWLIKHKSDEYDFVVVFANTGEELEETLEFVRDCDRFFGLNVVWVEADVQGYRQGTKARVVDFESASRNGEPFEAVIRKYGIPNKTFPHCSRELKAVPIRAYARSIGWKNRSYDSFIGIRADEFDRMSVEAEEERIIYPLVKEGITKPDINRFWDEQPFRLSIKSYEGNCKTCWKKSFRKLMTIAREHPERFDFTQRMEAKYGNVAPANCTERYVLPAYFYREKKSTQDILDAAANSNFIPAEDDRLNGVSAQQLVFDFTYDDSLDIAAGCQESCEAF